MNHAEASQLVNTQISAHLQAYDSRQRTQQIADNIDFYADSILKSTIGKTYDEAITSGGKDALIAHATEGAIINHIGDNGLIDEAVVSKELHDAFNVGPSPTSSPSEHGSTEAQLKAADALESRDPDTGDSQPLNTFTDAYAAAGGAASEAEGVADRAESQIGGHQGT